MCRAENQERFLKEQKFESCGYRLVVGHILAKDEVGVRFSLTAQKQEGESIAFDDYGFSVREN